MKKQTLNLFISSLFVAVTITAQTTYSPHKLLKKIKIAGDGGWDYLTVDEISHRLFVSHGNTVNVVDLKTDKTIASIPDTKGVHGITIANDLNKGFISNGRDTSISVFDLTTLQVLEKVKIKGINPDAILYDEYSHKVFVFNGRSKDATVLDARTNKIMATIILEGKPEFPASDGKGNIYVNIEDKNSISVIDVNTLTLKNTWNISPGEEPTGLALDREHKRLFAVCGNKMILVLNAENGQVITALPIGDGCDGVAFDSEKRLIFSSNGEGSITVIKQENSDTYQVIQTLLTEKGARTIALSKTTHQLYLPVTEYEEKPATKENPGPGRATKSACFQVLVVE